MQIPPTNSVLGCAVATLVLVAVSFGQTTISSTGSNGSTTSTPAPPVSIRNGASVIGPFDLPPLLGAALTAEGGRLTSANQAQVTLTGTTTDSRGTRNSQIIVQAPGLFSYREGQSYAITFNGTTVATKSGSPTAADEPILETLMAHLPDVVLLQAAKGGSFRHVGGQFRTDNGKTINYTGPFWTLLGFSPAPLSGLTPSSALQQSLFIALDERNSLISEIRVTETTGANSFNVTESQFTNWTQQGGQWFPGQIVRLENGQQTLSFQLQSGAVGAASPASAFQP